MQFVEAIEDFLVMKELEQGCLENTIQAYRYDLQLFHSVVQEDRLDQIRVFHIRRFLRELGNRDYKKASIARKIACLRSFFRFCELNEMIEKTPMARIQSPKLRAQNRLPKYMSEEEMQDFLGFLAESKTLSPVRQKRLHLIVRFLYASMARISELCNLRIRDINFARQTVNLFGKGAKERVVPIDEKTLTLLRETLEDRYFFQNLREPMPTGPHPGGTKVGEFPPDDPVFVNSRGAPMRPRTVQRDLQKARDLYQSNSGKHITAHVFRHTGATHLRQNGMDLSELQDVLGHASPNTTRIYAKNDIKILQDSYNSRHPLSQ